MNFLTEQDRAFFEAYRPIPETKIFSEEPVYVHAEPTLDVSIVVPCYNAAGWMRGCMDALCGQETACRYEIIAVNDGSTDGTLDILNEYAAKQPFLRVISQPNGGPGNARNAGTREAKGRYLLFVDTDDSVGANYVETLFKAAEGSHADLVGCGYRTVTPNGTVLKEVRPSGAEDRSILIGTPWAKLFARGLFAHILWPEGIHYEDTIFAWLIFPKAERVVTTDGCRYDYLSNSAGITQTTKRQLTALDTVYMTDKILGCVDEINAPQLLADQFYVNQLRLKQLEKPLRKRLFEIQSRFTREHAPDGLDAIKENRSYASALLNGSFTEAEISMLMEKPRKVIRLISSKLGGKAS